MKIIVRNLFLKEEGIIINRPLNFNLNLQVLMKRELLVVIYRLLIIGLRIRLRPRKRLKSLQGTKKKILCSKRSFDNLLFLKLFTGRVRFLIYL